MKKNEKVILFIFGSIWLIICLVFAIIVGYKLLKNRIVEDEQGTTEVAETTEEESEELRMPETEEQSEEVAVSETGFIFVGESHMVVADAYYKSNGTDIEDLNYDENLFFVHTGLSGVMGTSEWLTSEAVTEDEEGALTQIDRILKEHDLKKWYIMLEHGSSMSQYDKIWPDYENIYQIYKERYKQCELFVISVPPVQEKEFLKQTGVARSNQSIIDFNEYTKALIGEDHYLDYYEWFLDNGQYQDIIHFEGSTYKSLFNQIMGNMLTF